MSKVNRKSLKNIYGKLDYDHLFLFSDKYCETCTPHRLNTQIYGINDFFVLKILE